MGVEDLARSFKEAFVYSGQYSQFRGKKHGNSAVGFPGERFVICAQNHDQIGNRMIGDRLTEKTGLKKLEQAAVITILSPYLPLLFMGEEYGETAPFPYFISHGDDHLLRSIRRGRKHEFKSFAWAGSPPDPDAVSTFESAKLNWALKDKGGHKDLWLVYQNLLKIRREVPAFSHLSNHDQEVTTEDDILIVRRWCSQGEAMFVVDLSQGKGDMSAVVPKEGWEELLSGDGFGIYEKR